MSRVTWIFGQSGSGKTTLAEAMFYYQRTILDNHYVVWLDGDKMRKVWTDLGLSKEDRHEQNLRIARLAKMLSEQGFEVIVSTILPYRDLRKKVSKITNCRFIYIDHWRNGLDWKEYPFWRPELV